MSQQGGPGRYQRSVPGLVAAMVVLVVVVLAFVGFRKLVSAPSDVDQATPIDYLASVRDLQRSGESLVYPASLPAGWSAFNLDYTPGSPPAFGLDLHTADQRYIGLRQAPGTVAALLDTFVDPDPTSQAGLDTPGGPATTWAGWADAGGDHAYSATIDGQAVIVFGPAPVTDLQTVVRALTRAPITESRSPSPSPSPSR